VVKGEVEGMKELDPGEASDVEDELLDLIKSMKGLNG
jgi:hypothetical protein